jgi:hypothetical protein
MVDEMQEWADRDIWKNLCQSWPTSVETTRKKKEVPIPLHLLFVVEGRAQPSQQIHVGIPGLVMQYF